jgi:diguanylate cyclase (GGDEF)-like protein
MAANVLNTKPLYFYVVAVWLVLVVMFAAIIIDASIDSAKDSFDTKAVSLYHLINDQVNINETVLDGFAATVDAMGELDRAKIRDYAKHILTRYPHIFMFEIAEKVAGKDERRFEKEMQKRVSPDFAIREFGYESDRQWHQAGQKPFYLPITFMEPCPPASRKVLGLDLNSNSFFLRSLKQSAKLHMTVATKPFELVEGQIAYLVHRPIKDKQNGVDKDGVEDRYVMLVILAKSLFSGVLASMPGYGVTLYHSEFSKNNGKGILYKQHMPTPGKLTSLFFPKLVFTLPLQSKTQPFVLSVEKQLGWGMLNWGLLVILFIAAASTYYMVLRYAKAYHLTQVNRIQEANQFFYLANHDSLTGLANRNLLMDRLQHALKQAKRMESRLAVLFLDLDDFKQVNDQYGHEAGDRLLISVAERLRACVRSGDTLARRSGDEFVIILENVTSPDLAEQVVEKIQKAFAERFHLDGMDIGISISIGLATFPDEGSDATALLNLADKRMYEKK